MNLANVNHEALSKQIGQPVSEVMVVVAKHSVAGVGVDSLAELIGCDPSDIEALESSELYREVRGIIGALAASAAADQGLIWDSIEAIAGRKLLERIETSRDEEFLLRAAATANRMTRRNSTLGQPLEPARAGQSAAITLTRRMVERFTSGSTRVTEEQMSIHDGSMRNPQFEEVQSLLGLQPARLKAPPEPDVLRDLGIDSEGNVL